MSIEILGLPQAGVGMQTISPPKQETDAAQKAAQDFETAYIAQILTFSGLDKALTTGGGEEMSAFASFYIESLAENISENGGFGLAKHFYEQMMKTDENPALTHGKPKDVQSSRL